MRLNRARGALPDAGRAALLPAWQARGLLNLARRNPQRVADGTLQRSEFRRRAGLIHATLTARY